MLHFLADLLTENWNFASPRNAVLVELLLAALVALLAFLLPRFARRVFARIEDGLKRVAARPTTAILVTAITPVVIRLVLLPCMPVPAPSIHDEFAQLLAADTFAHGRLTNPGPTCWQHFESFHITVTPLHISMEPPLHGMVMAGGQAITSSPWVGVMLEVVLMSAFTTWMLFGWVRPYWALVGGLIVAIRFGVFSYWMNSYWGGALAAAGGALVLGALPRLLRKRSSFNGFLLGAGAMILANTRPFEGLTVCLAVGLALTVALLRGRLSLRSAARHIAIPVLLAAVPAMAFVLYYNQQTTGSAYNMAHQASRARYAIIPYWMWQPVAPTPTYNHEVMRKFFVDFEGTYFKYKTRSWTTFLQSQIIMKLVSFVLYFLTPALLIPVVVLFWTVPLRKLWMPATIFFALYAGTLASSAGFLPHYYAPLTSLVMALSIMGMRRIRVWRRHAGTGLSLSRWLLASIAAMCVLQVGIATRPRHAKTTLRYCSWNTSFGGTGFDRANALRELGKTKSLVFVRYSPDHSIHDEWVYNEGDIGNSTVILARDMGEEVNRCVINAYPGRKLLLLEPDVQPVRWVPYPAR